MGLAASCTLVAPEPDGPVASAAAGRPTVVVAAGDLAGPGDGDSMVAAQMARMQFAAFFTLGDHAFENGTPEQFAKYYLPVFGRFDSVTRPTPGNHDYYYPGAGGYKAYFSARAPFYPDSAIYYTFDLGGWRWFSLNSEISTGILSAQYAWLERELRAPDLPRCIGALWHRPLFSLGGNPPDRRMEDIWALLARAQATLVLNAHDRFQRWTPIDGITEFVAATGGTAGHHFTRDDERVLFRDDQHYGVLELSLWPDSARHRWVTIDGAVRDSGSVKCQRPAP